MPKANIKNDIRFIDPNTYEVICTYNGCKEYFDIVVEPKTEIHHPNDIQKREIIYLVQSRECSKCGRDFQLDVDKKATVSNKNRAITDSYSIALDK